MVNQFSRTELIYGKQAIEILKKSHVAVFGVGGVGGYVCEALARTGVGHFTLIDDDVVSLTNINRQIIATLDTVGKNKVDVMKERILSINKDCVVEVRKCFFLPSNEDTFNFKDYDYVVDAVDTVSAKISIISKCYSNGIKVISSMGAGNKINPMGFMVSDINKTEMDPLAKVIRRELRKRDIKHCKVVYSKEKPIVPYDGEETNVIEASDTRKGTTKHMIPGSCAFVPSACGLLIASEVVKDLTYEVLKEELK